MTVPRRLNPISGTYYATDPKGGIAVFRTKIARDLFVKWIPDARALTTFDDLERAVEVEKQRIEASTSFVKAAAELAGAADETTIGGAA